MLQFRQEVRPGGLGPVADALWVYYYGLRQTCADGPWPSFLNLVGTGNSAWDSLDKAQRTVELEAKEGKRFEVWVTAFGQLKTNARLSRLGPCDKKGSRYWGSLLTTTATCITGLLDRSQRRPEKGSNETVDCRSDE